MDGLIFDKLKVKISFPNQTLMDCSAAMKKPSFEEGLEI